MISERELSRVLNKSLLCNGVPPQTQSGHLFDVTDFRAYVDGAQLAVTENESHLKYETPKFIASGSVEVPAVGNGEQWIVGFIQACCYMRFFNTYTSGFSSWEFPQLIFGERNMISDSNGTNHPWYDICPEIVGPQKRSIHHLRLEDYFYPKISWTAPIEGGENDFLTKSERYQGFFTWLTAFDVKRNAFYPLRAVYWEMAAAISVDPAKPFGRRTVVEPKVASQPFIFDVNQMPALTLNAVLPPYANMAQALIYRPFRDVTSKVVLPPHVGNYQFRRDGFNDFNTHLSSTLSNVVAEYHKPLFPFKEIPTNPPAVFGSCRRRRNYLDRLRRFIPSRLQKNEQTFFKRQRG